MQRRQCIVLRSVADPDPLDPFVLDLLDPDQDPIPDSAPGPVPSVIKQK